MGKIKTAIWSNKKLRRGLMIMVGVGGFSLLMMVIYAFLNLNAFSRELKVKNETLVLELTALKSKLASASASLEFYLNQDQYLINQELQLENQEIEKTFKQTIPVYEKLQELRVKTNKTTAWEIQMAQILSLLADRKYASAAAKLTELDQQMKTEETKLGATFTIPANVIISNSPPNSGYSRQQVQWELGTNMVSMVAANLETTKVVVETASESTCLNDCPVLTLADYVAKSGAFAGINGPYFCPATYPTCAGKTNTFDTLIMNRSKVYFNSDNNLYSMVPAVIFSGTGARFVSRSSEWGRSTEVDSVIAAQPFLVSNNQVVFGGDSDPKKGSKGLRGFIGVTNNMVYIGHVHNATVAESARVLQTLGIQNALNLDGGGSAALWSGGYKVGPGRALPMAILLVGR